MTSHNAYIFLLGLAGGFAALTARALVTRFTERRRAVNAAHRHFAANPEVNINFPEAMTHEEAKRLRDEWVKKYAETVTR